MKRAVDRAVIEQLQQQILKVQGHKHVADSEVKNLDLGELESAFSDGIFPRGVMHELISYSSEEAASTSGFLSVLLSRLCPQHAFCLWISTRPRRSIFPPAMNAFCVDPSKIIFVDVGTSKDTLWALEEALKCNSLAAVVGEISELGFKESQRFQLAVEKSQVTGFIHRFRPKVENPVACVSRWKIKPLQSVTDEGMPGLGFTRWQVDLQKVKNGRPANWQVQWSPDGLHYIQPETNQDYERQIG